MVEIKNISENEIIFNYVGKRLDVDEIYEIPKIEWLRWHEDLGVQTAIFSGIVQVYKNSTPLETYVDQLAALDPYTVPPIETDSVSATSTVTTSSSTAAVVGSMTRTPDAGKYIAYFSGGIYTAGAGAQGEFGIYKNGTLIPETKRPISCNLQLLGGLVSVSLNNIGVGTYTGTEISVNGTDVVDVRFRSVNGGTLGFGERTFTLIKVR